jgi:hypothetical protein
MGLEISEAASTSGSMTSPLVLALKDRFCEISGAKPSLVSQALADAARHYEKLALSMGLPNTLAGERAPGKAIEDPAAQPASAAAASAAEFGLPITPSIARDAIGRPGNHEDVMRAALAQLLQLSVSRAPIRELMHAALQILHVGLGHQRVLLFLRDALTQVYRVRAARGLDADALFSPVGAITFNIEPSSARGQRQCLFTASLQRDAPLTIVDATSARSQAVLPDWFKARLPQVGSFLFLPITVSGTCFGGIYADRSVVDTLTSAADLTSIVMLRNQLVLALQAQGRPSSKA